jgi:hypothetical protein
MEMIRSAYKINQKDQKTLTPVIKMNYLRGNCFVNLRYTQVNHQESIIYGNNTYVILVLTPLSTIFQLLCVIWRTVLLLFNDTFNNVLVITYNMVTSFISVKVALNTNKTGHHVLRYT